MKVGAEPKKLVILAGLVAVAGWLLLSPGSDQPGPAGTRPASTSTAPAPAPNLSRPPGAARQRPRANAVREFRPSLAPPREGDRVDPMKIDPTLRLDLIEKLQKIPAGSAGRNLFEFAAAPPPKEQEPKIVPTAAAKVNDVPKETPEVKPEPAKPVKPPPPPIALKFYGYVSPAETAQKQAFFLDGDEIFVAAEGDIIRKRYKVVRIGVNSALVEDTQHKHQQSLPLVEQGNTG